VRRVNGFDEYRDKAQALVQAVAHQQLNGQAANTILSRFIALFSHGGFPSAQEVFDLDVARIAGVGTRTGRCEFGLRTGCSTLQNPHCLDPRLE
jgi:hypothetical protein